MQTRNLTPVTGVEISGIDVRQVSDADFAAIEKFWLDRCLIVIKDQHLSPSELCDFSRRFGELEKPPASAGRRRDEEAPEMWVISNVIENGQPIGALGSGEAEWHTDMSYIPEPPSASVLYGREVVTNGGNTWYANMYAAAEALPADLRAAIEARQANHDSSYTSAGELRKGMSDVVDVKDAPGARHPIIRNHPVTGRDTIYLGRRTNSWIVGMEVPESDSLLDALWAHCTRDEFCYSHRWSPNDLLVWDNRSAIHRRDSFSADERRVMWRCQVRDGSFTAAAA
ncbi:MAG: TauD/TfdA dioxygenase family protein [Minwuia sp.]|uniref:TauD/TfdA dioxygenase family protein n=1 Tax=Minwuia sp. TaxID=2493630 RepID=UPI003A88122C